MNEVEKRIAEALLKQIEERLPKKPSIEQDGVTYLIGAYRDLMEAAKIRTRLSARGLASL